MTSNLPLTHGQIGYQIAALERAVLAFQAGVVRAAGSVAADDTNSAIILSARLLTAWKRLGLGIPPERR